MDDFRAGINHFNSKRYFDAHEAWEKLWLEAGPEKLFLQGLIQIAVGFFHIENGNLDGGIMLVKRGCNYLSKYPQVFMGVDSGKLIKDSLSSIEKCSLSHPQIQQG